MKPKALNYVHSECLIHRDIKPANIMLVGESDRIIPSLIDFGACCEPYTTRGINSQKANHMHSPEVVFGGKVGAMHDFFCLGANIYLIASGRSPFQGGSQQLEMGNLSRKPPSELDDTALNNIVQQMLTSDPAQRLFGEDFLVEYSKYLASLNS